MTEETKRGNERKRRAVARAKERLVLVEQVLLEAWRWSTFDGKDVEALRAILRRADPDFAVHVELDRLVIPEGPR